MPYHKCPVCEKEFFATNWNRIYCSPKCARTAQAKQNMSHIARRSALKAVIPQKLLYAFGFRCCVCGWYIPQDYESEGYQPQHGREFHHIIPVSEGGNNTLDNIVLLCPNCHKMAHAGKFPIEKLRDRTKTMEDADKQREWFAMETGCGTYWVDHIFLNKGNFRQKLSRGEDI